jgi:hypothetical protein
LKPQIALALLLFASTLPATPDQHPQDWTNYVRIGAYGLKGGDAAEIVRRAQESNVAGIEVDNDIPGRYESFLDPTAKLKAIHDVADAAHQVGNHAFVYIAGTECITAHGDQVAHTMFKDHPDWLQRKITGEPAIFGGGTAFWIRKGDEDVWVSPYAPEWRKIYMERVRQIAATGIDGIYIDIPYWMTHFDGWEDTWASFDDFTVAAFKQQTGLDAKNDLKLGDFSDANFRKWVQFRIQTFTDFLAEIDRNAKSINPQIKTIPEIYPGIEEESVRVGADVYSLYAVVDAIAHEYEFGNGDHMASGRKPIDWFRYQVGMHSFRAFAQGKPTWILNYSWDGDKKVDAREAMMNLAMSQLMAGANFWDAPGHSMAGSNDLPTRKKIFTWIQAHEKTFYLPRSPMRSHRGLFFPADAELFRERIHSVVPRRTDSAHAEAPRVSDRHAAHAGGFQRQDVRSAGCARSERRRAGLAQGFRRAGRKSRHLRFGHHGTWRFAECSPPSGESRQGLQRRTGKRFRSRLARFPARIPSQPVRRRLGEDRSFHARRHFDCPHLRRPHQLLLRQLRRPGRRIESHPDAPRRSTSHSEIEV